MDKRQDTTQQANIILVTALEKLGSTPDNTRISTVRKVACKAIYEAVQLVLKEDKS